MKLDYLFIFADLVPSNLVEIRTVFNLSFMYIEMLKDRPSAVVKYSPLVLSGPGFDSASLHCALQG